MLEQMDAIFGDDSAWQKEMKALRAALSTPEPSREPTQEEVEALLEFESKASYLAHPDVRPFNGTDNGDSIEGWNRDLATAKCRAILAAKEPKS